MAKRGDFLRFLLNFEEKSDFFSIFLAQLKKMLYICTRNQEIWLQRSKINAEIAQLVEHNLAKVGVASSSLVFRSKSKSFEDKIKQNPLKHRFRGFCICCRSVSLRHGGAPTRHSPNFVTLAQYKNYD